MEYCGKTMSSEELAKLAIKNSKRKGQIVEANLIKHIEKAIHAKYVQGQRDEAIYRNHRSAK